MMKKLLKVFIPVALAFFAIDSNAQYIMSRNVAADTTSERYVNNSPGMMIHNTRKVEKMRDSTWLKSMWLDYQYLFYDSSRNDGLVGSIAWYDNQGWLKRSSLSNLKLNLSNTTGLQDSLDIRLRQGDSSLYVTPTYADRYYLATNPNGYISTEVDPTVPSYAKGLSGFNVIKTQTDNLYYPLENNPNNFLSGISYSDVIYALGYIPIQGSGTTDQYIAGDGSKIPFPSIPAEQVNSDWSAVSGISEILNKPSEFPPSAHTHVISDIINLQSSLDAKQSFITPSNLTKQYWNGYKNFVTLNSDSTVEGSTNLFWTAARSNGAITNTVINTALGYTPLQTEVDPTVPSYSKSLTSFSVIQTSTDPLYRPISYVPSFSEITSKPTTLSGYGITDGVTTTSLATTLSNYATTSALNSGLAGKVDNTRTITINGISQDLTGNRTWNVGTLVGSDTASLSNRINTKFNIPTGNSSQYLNGAGVPTTFPTIPTVVSQLTNDAGYINQAGARSSISLTTTGTSGTASYNSSTGVLNIPNYTVTGTPGYSQSGLVSSNSKIFTDTFSITSSTPTINLSSYLTTMGASNFKVMAVTAYRAGATVNNSPNVSVTGLTSTSVTLILNQTNTATISILGINVLSGLPSMLVPDPANVKVILTLMAW